MFQPIAGGGELAKHDRKQNPGSRRTTTIAYFVIWSELLENICVPSFPLSA